MARRLKRKGYVAPGGMDVPRDEEGNIVGIDETVIEAPVEPQMPNVEPEIKTETIEPEIVIPRPPIDNPPAIIMPPPPGGSSGGAGTPPPSAGSQKTKQYATPPPGGAAGGSQQQKKKLRGPIKWFEEEVLDMGNKATGPYSETTDRLAALGGYSNKTWRTIQEEKQRIADDYKAASYKVNSYEEELNEIKERRSKISEDLRRAKLNKDEIKVNNLIDEYNSLNDEYNRVYSSYRAAKNQQDKSKNESQDILREQSKYGFAVAKGEEIDKREHHWRKEWAKPIAENTAEMLGRPKIGDITDVVGYGQMTGKSASAGLNELVGGYRTAAGANEWTRTRVGDRQLVEALVNVRPSGMITEFGAPGTVGGGSVSRQFEYSTPLRRIAVGDVTARPGYILNIEDIHRKKQNKSAPRISRKKIMIKRAAIKKSGRSAVLGTITKLNSVATPGSLTLVKSIDNVGKAGILTIKSMGVNKQGSLKSTKKVTIEANPLTLNMGVTAGVGPITSKSLEFNLNRQSISMKKRRLVKV